MTLFGDSDYERFRDLLMERTGLYFREEKRRDLTAHLTAAMKEAAVNGPLAYYTRLYAAPLDSDLWTDLISRLTVGETYFHRNPAHFAALREHILPSLIQRRRESGHLTLRMWSAGCATGEEPYSLAVTLKEILPDIDAWSIMILATDIDRESLAHAAKGVYEGRSFRNDTPPTFRDRYFRPSDQGFELRPEVRRMVHFAYLNLVEDSYPSAASFTAGLDLIMCRNVTIYFDQATTCRVARGFHAALSEDGWLIVGSSEPLGSIYQGFEPRNFVGAVIYQKAPELEASGDEALPTHRHFSDTHASASDYPWEAATLEAAPTLPPPIETERVMPTQEPVAEPQAIDEPGETSARSCYETGKAFADRMQWAEAHEWLGCALAHEPLLIEAHFMRALVYQHQGDDQAALEALKRALYIDRNFVLGHFNLGVIYRRLGRAQEALHEWRIAQDLLRRMSPDELLPHGEDLTAGRLSSTLAMNLMGKIEDET